MLTVGREKEVGVDFEGPGPLPAGLMGCGRISLSGQGTRGQVILAESHGDGGRLESLKMWRQNRHMKQKWC